jgi:hypothetical protein
MSDTLTPLILDFLEWIAVQPRPYEAVMDVWRTSCPKLPVWEEANDRGFIVESSIAGREMLVELTSIGRRFLETSGRVVPT